MVVANEDVEKDPWSEPDNRISLSFKVHGGFDSPLINFSGSSEARIKQDIIAVFGIEVEDVSGETAFGLLAKAHEESRRIYLASEVLGATVDSVKKTSGNNWGNRSSKPSTQPDSVGKKEKPANPEDGVVEEIKAAATRGDLNKIFAKNSTGNLKVNGGWKTEAQCAAATERFKELAAK